MRCATCETLLEVYEKSVQLYSASTAAITGALEDDFFVALGRCQKTRNACQDAFDALMSHWRFTHKPEAVASMKENLSG